MKWNTILVVGLFACNAETEQKNETCMDMCNELQGTCGYDAYPDVSSCVEGCLYNEEEGANTTEQLSCILEAECDTFAILECENQHGVNSNE